VFRVVLPALVLWFAALTVVYRVRLLDRILGLDQLPY
jgi:cation-transporting P-type ATPase E